MALADHDPSLVGHRVWTTDAKIDARLGELAHHVEDVLQASLRDRFQRIEDYNDVAGSMAEPYRGVAAVGFPEGLTRDGYRHLRALLESGLRCGIFTVLVCDRSKPWPSDMPIPSGDKVQHLEIDESGDWHLRTEHLERLPFRAEAPPANSLRTELVEKIGQAAVAASRVEIPLESLLSSEQQGEGRTDDGIRNLDRKSGRQSGPRTAIGRGSAATRLDRRQDWFGKEHAASFDHHLRRSSLHSRPAPVLSLGLQERGRVQAVCG